MKDEMLIVAIEDIRARHDALRELIVLADQQALGLLQMFIPVASAAATGAVIGLTGATLLPAAITVSLSVVTLLLLVGSLVCLRAMNTATIGLSGRDGAFWRWASLPEISAEDVGSEYFLAAEESIRINRCHNENTARLLMAAKRIAIWTPAIALVAGGITWLLLSC